MNYKEIETLELIELSDSAYDSVADELGSSGKDALDYLIAIERELAVRESEEN